MRTKEKSHERSVWKWFAIFTVCINSVSEKRSEKKNFFRLMTAMILSLPDEKQQ